MKPALLASAILLVLGTTLNGESFQLRPLEVYAEPGDFNVRVPLVLDNSEAVGAWEILISYDTTGGRITRVDIVDSVQALDPDGDTLAWFHSSWSGDPEARPEYLSFVPDADGYPDRVRVIGFMDMPPPPAVPPVPEGEDFVLFCFVFNVYQSWQGSDILITFQTDTCKDNTLADPTGYSSWGPDTLSADPSTCPQRADSMRVIRLNSGAGIVRTESVQDDEYLTTHSQPFFGEISPNPFRDLATIPYHLPPHTSAQVTVWGADGRRKRILLEGSQPGVSGVVRWDGTDDNGVSLPSGVYFLRIVVNSETAGMIDHLRQTKKLVLIR